jgi:hypothetical protein
MLGSDNLLYVPTLQLATTTKAGALQKLSGNTTDVLNGTNAFGPVPLATNANQGGIIALSNKATDFLDGTNHFRPIAPGFIAKTAAYTLTAADSGKYVVCSGGSWTLTLPAPAVGLLFQVRNDMGISGTTGTITLQPTGGTIDGLTTRLLLPQQECTLITDGTNWRTLGLQREVILGTQDITSSTASGSILLPAGYRYFELGFNGLIPATANASMVGQLSVNGGSTWIATTYYHGILYNSSITAAAFSDVENDTGFWASTSMGIGNPGQSKLIIYPGSATVYPTWILDAGARGNAGYQVKWNGYGLMITFGPANAFKYNMNSGNIANSFLTVKGIV